MNEKQVKLNEFMIAFEKKIEKRYVGKTQSFNPGLQYPTLHGPVHTPDNNRWDTPPV